MWRNWHTRSTQNAMTLRSCGFNSHHAHQMLGKLISVFLYFILLASVVLLFASFKNPDIAYYVQSFFGMAPCQKPILYSFASIDERFNITENEAILVMQKSEGIWEKAAGKELFQYSTEGKLKVSFLYDSRQKVTDELKNVGSTIENSTESYETMKAELDKKKALYDKEEASLKLLLRQIETDKAKFDSTVSYWNKRGGTPEKIFNELNAERERLQLLIDEANEKKDRLVVMVREINALIDAVNSIARKINMGVDVYNKIGQTNGKKFEEGIYKSSIEGKAIEIYQFHDRLQLERVLAHELGHALGLEHVTNPKAIMFELNQSTNMTQTADDIREMKTVCRMQ